MPTREEAQRLAAALNQLRPDWGASGLMTVIGDQRLVHRPMVDVAVAFVALALDPQTRKPTRIFETGPWWLLAAPRANEHNTSAHIRRPAADDCDVCHQPRHPDNDHAYVQLNSTGYGTPMPDEVRSRLAEVAEAHHLAATAEREAEPEKPAPPDPEEVLAKHTPTAERAAELDTQEEA